MATTKISELNPLASGSTCAAAVLPIVNDGVTDKISIDNLRGTLRGASNQGPANAALNGGINNTACRLGDGVLGGQANTVNGNFKVRTAADGNYNYNGPEICSSGSLSNIIGGLANKIEINSALISAGYPLPPTTIMNSVGSCITGSATSAYAGYYPIAGGDMIVGGHGNTITGPTANGNYASGLNLILGSYNSRINFQSSEVDGVVANYNNAIINSWNSEIKKTSNPTTQWTTTNTIIGGGAACILQTNDNMSVFQNTIIGAGRCIVDSRRSSIVGSFLSCIENIQNSAILGGNYHIISGSSVQNDFGVVIIGGASNCVVGNLDNAVIVGGSGVTGSLSGAVHIQNLVFKTGVTGIPTSDPNHLGQVWNDAGTLKISLG